MTTSQRSFGSDTTTDEVLDGVDLSGTVALVTGASAGLGAETVRALAARGATVIAAARDTAKAEKVLAPSVAAAAGRVTIEAVDLASLASVREFTDRIAARYDHLDLLIANAGVMATPEGRTADGFETQFGTNHLGHFVLVNRLVPLLIAGAPSRVVTLSSSAHQGSDVDLDDVNLESTPYNPWLAYSRSKTANAQFAVELDRRLRDRGVRACSLHPGMIETELFRYLDDDAMTFVMDNRPATGVKSVAAGAATTVWAAVVADAGEIGGAFAEDCAVAEVRDGERSYDGPVGVRSYVLDPERGAALWTRSEELVGEQFSW